MKFVVSKRYAQALFELTEESGISEQVQDDLQGLDILCKESAEFRQLIFNPVISVEVKQQMLDLVLKSKLHAQTLTFLHFLADKQRLSWLPTIIAAYWEMYLAAREMLPATIECKVSMSKSQIEKILAHFHKLTSKKILPQLKERPEMLGGFTVKINDMIYDHSIESKLRKFKYSVINH